MAVGVECPAGGSVRASHGSDRFPGVVEGEKAGQHGVVVDACRPAVCGRDRGVEGATKGIEAVFFSEGRSRWDVWAAGANLATSTAAR